MGQRCAKSEQYESEVYNRDDDTQRNEYQNQTFGAIGRGDDQTTTPKCTEAPPAKPIIASSTRLEPIACANRITGKRPLVPKINAAAFVSVVAQVPAPLRKSEDEFRSAQADGAAIVGQDDDGKARPLGIAPRAPSTAAKVTLPPSHEPDAYRWSYPTGSVLSIPSEVEEEAVNQD